MKWGSVDHRILPPDSEAYVATEKLATEFGPETSSATLLLDGTDQADVAAYTAGGRGRRRCRRGRSRSARRAG